MPADRVLGLEVEPEEVQVRDAGDAVGAVGQLRSVVAIEVEHRQSEDLTEAEGHDGEVVTAGDPQGGRTGMIEASYAISGTDQHHHEERRFPTDRRER